MYAKVKVRAKSDFICPETGIEIKATETKEVLMSSYVEKAIDAKILQEVKSTSLELVEDKPVKAKKVDDN